MAEEHEDKKKDPSQPTSARDNPKEQEDILAHKDHVIKSDRGLQQWGSQEGGSEEHDAGLHGEQTGQYGDASMGTAARQARIGGLAPGHVAGEGILKSAQPARGADEEPHDADEPDQESATDEDRRS